MEELLLKLKNKAYQNRKAAIIENGSWAPSAARKMKEYLESMKDVEVIEPVVTITTTVKPETEEQLRKLAEAVKNA
jgi:flavorubredoxin